MKVPKTMNAMLLTGHGGVERLQHSSDWPVPKVGAGEVLVKVGACGINNTDIWVREGAYGSSDNPDQVASFGDSPIAFPLIQGADIVGVIVSSGAGIVDSRIGERVLVDFGVYGGDGDDIPSHDYLGSARPGGFAEYCALPAENAYSIETSLTDAELATFCCAYVTGEHMLRRTGVTAHERVLVTGASGGVGSGVIQLCRARGAIPYAVTGAGKEDAVKAIGAEEAILRDGGDLVSSVLQATKGAPIDVVIDTVSGPMLPQLIEILRPQGRYATCGAVGGPVVEVDTRRIYLKNLDIFGATQGTRRDFRTVLDYILSGAIKPLLARKYPLKALRQAQDDFKKKDFIGKLVIEMA